MASYRYFKEIEKEMKKEKELHDLNEWFKHRSGLASSFEELNRIKEECSAKRRYIINKYESTYRGSPFCDQKSLRELVDEHFRSESTTGVRAKEEPKRRRNRKKLTTFINIEE